MVKTVHEQFDDDTHEKLVEIKDSLDLTWRELIERGAECLASQLDEDDA